MSHYYEYDPNLKSEIKTIRYDYLGVKLEFKTDHGVFSRDRVDFGTNLLLNTLISSDLETKKVLDLGCGYGVIGLSIAKKYPSSIVHMVDVNDRAIELTKLNSDNNKLKNTYIYKSNIYENIEINFDTIISNPPIRAGKAVVHEIVLGGYSYLNSGGTMYVVIQKKQGAPSLIKEMEEVFDVVEILEKKSGYYIIRGEKIVK